MIHLNNVERKQTYRDVRKRYSDRATDADIIVTLEMQNNILIGRCRGLKAECDNLKRMYTELMEKYKEVKGNG